MARVVEVDQDFRDEIQQAIDRLGLGVTSPETGVSRETVRQLLAGVQARFNIGTLATLCLNLELTGDRLTVLGYPQVAKEMERRAFNNRVRSTFTPR